MAADVAAPKRGRRLSSDRSDVILGTVLDLLKEVGYDQIRMQDVADRAGVGLSTIYRRWPTKQDVVRAALECEQATEKYVTTGDARADVKSFLKEMAETSAATAPRRCSASSPPSGPTPRSATCSARRRSPACTST